MQPPTSEQLIFFEQAASQYQRDLAGDTRAQEYLLGRGIGPEAAATFRLGVLRNPQQGHEMFAGRLAIPYLTPSGVVTFSFRCLEDHVCKDTVLYRNKEGKPVTCPKYRAPEGAERTVYNVLDLKKDSQTIYICEGEIDTMTLSLCGFPAVGLPGVTQWKPFFARLFVDYTHKICVADGDDSGNKMARHLAVEISSKTVRPPRGKDVNKIYTEGGINAVRQWLAGA